MGPVGQNAHKILNRLNCGRTFAKWGKTDEIQLKGIISDKNVRIKAKNWNSLIKF